jgi:hypothetical protein
VKQPSPVTQRQKTMLNAYPNQKAPVAMKNNNIPGLGNYVPQAVLVN